MKILKNFLLVILIYWSSTLIAQERADYFGNWKRTTNIVIGIESNYPATLSINDDGTYKETKQDFQGKEWIYNGTWEVADNGDLKLIPEDAYEKTYTNYNCFNISKDKQKIYFNLFEDTDNKTWTAKDIKQVTVYTKMEN